MQAMRATKNGLLPPTKGFCGKRARSNAARRAEARVQVSVQAEVSVVVPVYNEADNLRVLVGRIAEGMQATGKSYEMILVDDGSSDGSTEVLHQLATELVNLRVVVFRRNYGQTAGLSAGFQRARGHTVVTLDADLQNDPADIPRLIHELENGGPNRKGFDVVCGWRKDRKDNALVRNLPSRVANRLIRKATGVNIQDTGCSLKAFRSWVAHSFELYGELHRFLPMMAAINGATVSEIEVAHSQRYSGVSKYSALGRIPRVLADLVTIVYLRWYFDRPMHVWAVLGLAYIAGGVLSATLGALAAAARIRAQTSLLLECMAFCAWAVQSGLVFLAMGLILDIGMRIYYKVSADSHYQVREEYGCV